MVDEVVGSVLPRRNYAPVLDVLTTFDLPIEGAIPPELTAGICATVPTHDTTHHIGSRVTA